MKPFENLLCDDEELDFLKRAFQSINEATRLLKADNDMAAIPDVQMPRNDREWKEYGKKNPNW